MCFLMSEIVDDVWVVVYVSCGVVLMLGWVIGLVKMVCRCFCCVVCGCMDGKWK